jgi:putative transposase
MQIIRKAYRFRLKTDTDIESKLLRFCGSGRFLWNKCLSMNLARLEKDQRILWYQEMAFWLKFWKRTEEYGFLQECPSQVLQQKLMDLERAFKECFDRRQPLERLPVFKKRGRGESIRFPQGSRIQNRRLFLPKVGWIGFHKSREIPKHPSESEIGIDAGVICFAAFSNGIIVKGVNSFRKHEERLARHQKRLSRKQRCSRNWKKQKRTISRLHHRIANVRNDFLHKLSTEICKNHAKVYVEKLQIRNMSASARGTMDDPGRSVKAKSGLNKSILDQGWYRFHQLLKYKLDWQGGRLVGVDCRHTSQRCSCCGHTAKENRPLQAVFRCMACGYEDHADVNAAKNMLTVGRMDLACEVNRTSGQQQEPAGNREEVLTRAF